MLNITKQPIQVNQSETITFQSLHMVKDNEGFMVKDNEGLRASVTFAIKNDSGDEIRKEQLVYAGEEWNTFWTNFNSGKFLYDELIKKQSLEIISKDKDEDDFVNVAKPVKEEEEITDDVLPIDDKNMGEDILVKP